MKKIILIVLAAAILMSLGCGRSKSEYQAAGAYSDVYPFAAKSNTMGLIYEDSYLYEYNPISASGTEELGVFRDMSNLYGRLKVETDQSGAPFSPAAPGSGANIPENYERKLVKSASISIRVENLETSDKEIDRILKQYDAYSATTIAEENSRNYSLRVPSHFYDTFLEDIIEMGRVISRRENTEDVTIRYYDLEGRLATKKELLRTYQSYLIRAANIEEILKVEAKISELQYEIEHTGIQLRNLGNQVDYATISLYILGPVAVASKYKGDTFAEKIKQLFNGFGGFLSGMAVGLIGFIIYGIPILAILALLFWLLFGKVGLARKLWGILKK